MRNLAPILATTAAAALLGGGLAAPAHAAAWTQPQGSGQVIVTGIVSDSAKGFDANGNTVDINDYDKGEAYALIEYGVTDDLTVMAIPSFSDVQVENGGRTTGLGYTELGARYRIAAGGGAVVSLQGSVRIPGEKRRDGVPQADATGSEIDLRALAGTSFKLGGKDSFVDAQAGYRIRNGAPPNEFRLDLTLGLRPAPKVLLLLQSFNVVSDGDGRGAFTRYRYSNLYGSVVYDVTPKWSLQAGLLGTIAGRNALRERGVILGLWRRF